MRRPICGTISADFSRLTPFGLTQRIAHQCQAWLPVGSPFYKVPALLTHSYHRTEAGRAEVKARELGLSRSARNLLLVLDASRPAAAWLGLVQGASAADLEQLLAHGLVADAKAAPANPATATTAVAPVAAEVPASAGQAAGTFAQSPLAHAELYDFLTRHAKQHLGLIKGYKLVLEVERCADLAALRALADRFVQEVLQAQGEMAAEQVRRALGIIKPQGEAAPE